MSAPYRESGIAPEAPVDPLDVVRARLRKDAAVRVASGVGAGALSALCLYAAGLSIAFIAGNTVTSVVLAAFLAAGAYRKALRKAVAEELAKLPALPPVPAPPPVPPPPVPVVLAPHAFDGPRRGSVTITVRTRFVGRRR